MLLRRKEPAPSRDAAALLAGLPVPAILIDPDGRPRLANLAAELFLNVSQAALAERGWAAAFPAGCPVIDTLQQRARIDGGGCAAYDEGLDLLGGRAVRADILLGPVGDMPGWLALAFQTRSMVSIVERQVAQQGAARSAVGVAAMLAHEIKNPLSGIRGAAQLLGQSASGDAGELTALIVAEVDRIAALVDSMEGFTDTRVLAQRPENIHEVLGHVRLIAEQGFARGRTLREWYDPSLPLVAGHRDALVQLFLNLLKNAAEAAGENGTITLSTAYKPGLKVRPRDGGRPVSLPLEVRVIDDGPGVPETIGDHVFEPFVTSKPGGTGLGLALVAKIAADHGGIVEYQRLRDPDRTVFRVLLPMAGTT